MKCGDYDYIWQRPDWPAMHYDLPCLSAPLAAVSKAQGHLLGRLADAGLPFRDEALLNALSADVIGTSKIEGEHLQASSVRSSIARRLGIPSALPDRADQKTEGIVDLMLDASLNCESPLTQKRLKTWHASLFPTGYSGLSRISTGTWRDDALGPMQVVSGRIGKQLVHFEAPPAKRLDAEIKQFLEWVSGDHTTPALLKAGIGHLWFVTIHPFDDGNGRIARAIGDLLLARADGNPHRFYSLSAQIERERKDYYAILEQTQKGDMDITPWLLWFLHSLEKSIAQANITVDRVLLKARFWQRWHGTAFNSRQIKILNRLLDGFDANLTTRRWASMAPCSPDTALRDITELMRVGVLEKSDKGGRSTAYRLYGQHKPDN